MSETASVASVSENAEGVIFDLDGTLYTVRSLGFHIALGLLRETKPLRALFRVRKEMRGNDYGDRRTFKSVFSEILGKYCKMPPDKALDWYENRFMRRFTEVLGKRGRVRPGLIPLLEALRSRGIRLGVVSDFGAVPERLDALGISPSLFDDVEAAEHFGVMKPTAVPFQRLAERWHLCVERLVLVGDRADHDLGSARLLPAPFVGIENKNHFGEGFYPWDTVVRLLGEIGR